MEQENVEKQKCPDCLEDLIYLDGQIMKCKGCGVEIPLDIYMMSLQILEKELLISTLKTFLQNGVGKCVKFHNKYFIVGFDQDGDLITQQHILKDDEQQGFYVSITLEQQQNGESDV